jgi:hypothetical protein
MKSLWMKVRRWWAAFLIAVFGAGAVMSQTVTDTLSWTAPSTRVDGSALTAAEIASYKVYSGAVAGGPKTLLATVTTLGTTSARGSNPVGTRCYDVTTVDSTGLESAHSVEACKTVTGPPTSPSNLVVK